MLTLRYPPIYSKIGKFNMFIVSMNIAFIALVLLLVYRRVIKIAYL